MLQVTRHAGRRRSALPLANDDMPARRGVEDELGGEWKTLLAKSGTQGWRGVERPIGKEWKDWRAGNTIETNESDEHAMRLFERVIRDLGVVPEIVHADNGNPMRGMTLAVFLDSLQIRRSYSRPRCSNDNAYIESWHKTLKYTVGYPPFFESLEKARSWYADFIDWYNTDHQHSGLGYVTPMQRRSGEATAIHARRNQTLQDAFIKNPLRWRQSKVRSYQCIPVFAFYRPVKKAA